MSAYIPPLEILPIFNPSVFTNGESQGITLIEGDARYVKKSGSIMTGQLTAPTVNITTALTLNSIDVETKLDEIDTNTNSINSLTTQQNINTSNITSNTNSITSNTNSINSLQQKTTDLSYNSSTNTSTFSNTSDVNLNIASGTLVSYKASLNFYNGSYYKGGIYSSSNGLIFKSNEFLPNNYPPILFTFEDAFATDTSLEITQNNITTYKDILPASNGVDNIGSISKFFLKIYSQDIQTSNHSSIDTAITSNTNSINSLTTQQNTNTSNISTLQNITQFQSSSGSGGSSKTTFINAQTEIKSNYTTYLLIKGDEDNSSSTEGAYLQFYTGTAFQSEIGSDRNSLILKSYSSSSVKPIYIKFVENGSITYTAVEFNELNSIFNNNVIPNITSTNTLGSATKYWNHGYINNISTSSYPDLNSTLGGIATNSANISANSASISANTSAISTNSASISANTSAISTNSSAISTNSSAISTNSANISANSASISANSASISANSSAISTNSANISANTSAISTNSASISANSASISANSSAISTNSSAISTNSSAISTLQTKTQAITYEASPTPTQSTNTSASQTTIDSNLFVQGSNIWLRGSGDNITNRLRFHHSDSNAYIDWEGTGALPTLNFRYDTTNKFILSSSNASFSINTIPTTTATYDLGSGTNYWKHLYVGNISTNLYTNLNATLNSLTNNTQNITANGTTTTISGSFLDVNCQLDLPNNNDVDSLLTYSLSQISSLNSKTQYQSINSGRTAFSTPLYLPMTTADTSIDWGLIDDRQPVNGFIKKIEFYEGVRTMYIGVVTESGSSARGVGIGVNAGGGNDPNVSVYFCSDMTTYFYGQIISGDHKPATDANRDLGSSSLRWDALYIDTSPIITSDINNKNSIESLDEIEMTNFIKKLNPVKYKYNNGIRYHSGLIAQEVKENMPNWDWGLYINDEETQRKALRYTELIAPLISTIQHLIKENENLKKENEDIKNRLDVIEQLLGL